MNVVALHLLGVGNVGRCLVRQVIDNEVHHKEALNLCISIYSVSDSHCTVVAEGQGKPLEKHTLLELIQLKSSGGSFKEYGVSKGKVRLCVGGIDEAVATSKGLKTVVADCSASDDSYKNLLKAIEAGAGVVLANKKPLVTPIHFYDRFMQNWRRNLRWEATVGAGCPMIASQMRLVGAGDRISKMIGTFSGTLGFVMTGLEQGKKFSEVVKEAARLGYTEPDPRDDLGGIDVARKALILARGIGWKLEMSHVVVEPLYPPSMASLSVPEFINNLSSLDDDFSKRVAAAAKDGKRLRYAASVVDNKCVVGPVLVDASSPLGLLSGTNNMIEYHSLWYSNSPLVIQGPGAGGDQTAAGVLSDIVELAYTL